VDDGRGTRERHHVGWGDERAARGLGVVEDLGHGAVGDHRVHDRAVRGEFALDHVARVGGHRIQETASSDPAAPRIGANERVDQALGGVRFAYDARADAAALERPGRGRTHGRRVDAGGIDARARGGLEEVSYGVAAGEDNRVVARDPLAQASVERRRIDGGHAEGRDADHVRTRGAQGGGQFGGVACGARHQDAAAKERGVRKHLGSSG